MRTIRLTIEYDGTAYVGWQRQAKGRSIQQLLEEALGQVVRAKVVLHSSGRTDAGVHARAMIAHFRTESPFPLVAFREGVNRFLPDDIAVREAVEETADFHARFSAGGKWYRYQIFTAPVRSPATTRTSWHIRQPLDFDAMQAAARFFIGRHDFAAFRTTSCDARTTVREITAFNLRREGELITIDVRGSGFLRHMVRIIVGTLVEIGLHKRPAEEIPRLLHHEPGLRAGVNAPPQGLCLMEVYYPERELPREPEPDILLASPALPVASPLLRALLLVVGFLATALGVLGIFLPLLPTVPLLLLAAACFARSSPRLYTWLLDHPRLGPMFSDYLDGSGIPLRAKIWAILLLWTSISLSILLLVPILLVKLTLIAVAIGVTIYLLRLPTRNEG